MPAKPVQDKRPVKGSSYGLTWAQLRDGAPLKRVFAIDIEKCDKCGGKVRVIGESSHRTIEDPEVIEKILNHLGLDQAAKPHSRSPPTGLFDRSANLL